MAGYWADMRFEARLKHYWHFVPLNLWGQYRRNARMRHAPDREADR